MLNVHLTPDGRRVIEAATPHLRARIVDGVVELWEPRDPEPEPEPRRPGPPGAVDPAEAARNAPCCDPPPADVR